MDYYELTEDTIIRRLVYNDVRRANDKDEMLIEVITNLLKLRNKEKDK